MSQQEILGVMRKRYPPANQQATSTESTKNAPEIPPVESPTEARPPFAQPPPQQVGGEGALEALGEYAPTIKKALSSEQASPSLDGQRPSESPVQAAQGGRMPFQGALAKEPRKPELISTLAIEQAERPAAGPKLMSDSERTALEGQVKDLRKQFTQAASEEADRIQKMLNKDKAKRPYTEEQAAAESLKLKQEVWPEFDVRKFAVGEIPTQRTLTADDILAGYKQSSINPKLMEDPTIWRSLGITPLSPQERSELEASLSGAAQASSFAATKSDFLGGYGQLGLRMSDEEKQQAEKRLAIDDALKKGIPTTSLDDNPTASLLLHNRIITKKANDAYDGNVGRYMDITESRSIVPFLNEAEQQENKILSDIRSLEQVWSTQIAAGNKEVAEETLKTITKKKAEYTKLQADKQFSIDSQIRELSLSDDPNAKRKMQVLRAQKELAMMTDEEREKYALQKAVPGADTLRETVFKGMSDRDILRLTLHTKYLQYEQLLGSGIARGVNRLFDSEVEKLNEEIAILAPVVMLNKTPIKKIDEGFFSTAGKSVAAEFGGFGTERAKAERLNRVLQEADVMAGVAPAVSTGIEAAQDIGTWSKEAWGETTGTSLAFMAELIPTAVMTEAGLGAMRVPALVEKGANILKLVNAISGSRKALIGGRVLKGAYEAAKQGLSYELGGRIYDKKDEMNFLSGALGGLGGYVAGGAATRAASAIEKRIMATFGSAAPAVTQKVIDYGKRITAGGVRSIGQGVGETVEEFGEALGGIINESDSAQEILNGLKEQFPNASSVFHFAAQSFVMGSIMGQSNMIGNALWNRTKKLYASLNREERDMLDQLVQETNDVSEGVREELAKPVEEQAKAITPVGAPGSETEVATAATLPTAESLATGGLLETLKAAKNAEYINENQLADAENELYNLAGEIEARKDLSQEQKDQMVYAIEQSIQTIQDYGFRTRTETRTTTQTVATRAPKQASKAPLRGATPIAAAANEGIAITYDDGVSGPKEGVVKKENGQYVFHQKPMGAIKKFKPIVIGDAAIVDGSVQFGGIQEMQNRGLNAVASISLPNGSSISILDDDLSIDAGIHVARLELGDVPQNEFDIEFNTITTENQIEVPYVYTPKTTQQKPTADAVQVGTTAEVVEPVLEGEMTVRSFAESIASGTRLDTPEAVQFYENNKKEIEAELQRMANPSTSVITDDVVAAVSEAASSVSKPNEVKTSTLPNGVEYAVGVLTNENVSNKISVVDGAANELVDKAQVINVGGRWVARVKLPNGKTFPFYVSSSGTSGKDAGKWYPFFGVAPSGWIVKGSVSELESEYGVPELQEISKKLNATLRIPGSFMDPVTGDIVSGGSTVANISDFGLSMVDRVDANNDNEINEFLGLPPVPDITHKGGKANEQWKNTVLSLAGLSAPSKTPTPTGVTPEPEAPPTPKEETMEKMQKLSEAEGLSNKKAREQTIKALRNSDPRLKEIMDTFVESVEELEKAGKITRKCRLKS
jgi:hypothetical protein